MAVVQSPSLMSCLHRLSFSPPPFSAVRSKESPQKILDCTFIPLVQSTSPALLGPTFLHQAVKSHHSLLELSPLLPGLRKNVNSSSSTPDRGVIGLVERETAAGRAKDADGRGREMRGWRRQHLNASVNMARVFWRAYSAVRGP